MRALVVDDEEDIGLMTKLILKKTGIVVDDINRVNEARKKIIENHYDIFFLDLHLPDGSGFDLMPLIRERNKDAGIVIISAYDGPLEKQKAKEFGIVNFIKKPFSKQDLYEAVDQVTSKKHG